MIKLTYKCIECASNTDHGCTFVYFEEDETITIGPDGRPAPGETPPVNCPWTGGPYADWIVEKAEVA